MGELRPCCVDLANRGEPQPTDKPELIYTVCRVCGAKHYELSIDPVTLQAEAQPLR